jgi:hypothetical protein
MSVAGVYTQDGTGSPSALAAAALAIAAAMAAAAIAIVAASEAGVAVAADAAVISFAVLDTYVTLTANAIVSWHSSKGTFAKPL